MVATHVGGSPQQRPRRGSGGRPSKRRPPVKRADPRFVDGPDDVLGLQTTAGNAAVSRLVLARRPVQRDQPPGTAAPANSDVTAALAEQLAVIQDAIAANELDDPPEAARQERALLLVQFAHPAPFADRDAVIDFVSQCDATAAREDATLAKLGKDAGQAVIQHPQAFPQTWADQLAKSLDLGIDDASLTGEKQRGWEQLVQVGGRIPGAVSEYGLPVSLAEIRALKSFELEPDQAKLPESDVIRDFAQAALAYRGTAVRAEMVRWWKRVLHDLVENVRSGDETIDPAEIAKITGTKGKFADFLNSGMAPGEDQFRELDAEVAKLQELTMLTAIISVASGLHASAQMWQDAGALFKAKLAEADAIVDGWGVAETIKHAFLWMLDRGYVGDQFLLIVSVMRDNIGEILEKLALFGAGRFHGHPYPLEIGADRESIDQRMQPPAEVGDSGDQSSRRAGSRRRDLGSVAETRAIAPGNSISSTSRATVASSWV